MHTRLIFLLATSAALLCGCSAKKEPEPKVAAHEPAQKSHGVTAAPAGRSVTCTSQVIAYNPSDPSKKLGFFKTGSELHVSETAVAPGMVLVTYQDQGGPLITAFCRAEDLGMVPTVIARPVATATPATSSTGQVKPKSLGGSRPTETNPNYKPIGQ